MKFPYALVVAIVCLRVASTQRPAHLIVDTEVRKSEKSSDLRGESAIATRSHSSLQVLRSAEGDHGHEMESLLETSPFSSGMFKHMVTPSVSTAHGKNLLQIAGRTDWIIAKIVLGGVLLLPALPSMIGWLLSGHSPYPFLLNQNAVPSWTNNQYELVSAMALLGLDLILLAGVEYDWRLTMSWLRVFLVLQYGVLGFACLFYGIMSENSPYRSKVPVPAQDDSDAQGEDASAGTANPFRDALASQVMGSVTRVKSSVGHLHAAIHAWVHIPKPLLATTQYQDVGTPLVRLCVLILAQSILVGFYFIAMEEEVPLTPKAYAFWMAALPMQIMAKTQMGLPFCHEACFWNDMLHAEADAVVQRGDDESAPTIKLTYANCLIRAVMSFYANSFCIALIALTLPLFMLSAASEIDFVKDCFAVVFITTLDDLSKSVALHIKPALPV